MGKYRDVDALAFEKSLPGDEDGRNAVNHIQKRLKNKTSEVLFNPEQHKEFITGFRKRKQQRRAKAIKQLEDKAKQERLQYRSEKRAKLKADLGLDDRWGIASSDSEVEKEERPIVGAVKVYADQGVTTTVTTLALDSGPESSSEGEEEGDEKDKTIGGIPVANRAYHGGADPGHHPSNSGRHHHDSSQILSDRGHDKKDWRGGKHAAQSSTIMVRGQKKRHGKTEKESKGGGGAAMRLQKLNSIMKKGSKGGKSGSSKKSKKGRGGGK
ncbi:hypothetical protein CEUSTIGMA_g7134.t1 [Chlamydomonas eustigma]|uniref:Ribosomal RNA-processing protein 17 n=1 Tax=Chlamydomonas eustigma TaxID=1157962 RepID=A0A250X9D1_9CHLO|nr:hypothetical protein CEUSTIGMA_g7134.t1 [Chlamydomonas eustigma]|eukprot:GAX79693.1 hypothetical protein CEUSTIGMA_g7134.t1 [Chlamydomonas eustigma]